MNYQNKKSQWFLQWLAKLAAFQPEELNNATSLAMGSTLHFTTFNIQHSTLHYTPLQCAPHCISLHIRLHCTQQNESTIQTATVPCNALRIALPCTFNTIQHYTPQHYTTFHYTQHYITHNTSCNGPYIALHFTINYTTLQITLHSTLSNSVQWAK